MNNFDLDALAMHGFELKRCKLCCFQPETAWPFDADSWYAMHSGSVMQVHGVRRLRCSGLVGDLNLFHLQEARSGKSQDSGHDSLCRTSELLCTFSLQTQNEIEQLKLELDAARIERQNQEECESFRETIAAEPSRAHSMKSIKETQQEIAEMERELAATALIVEHRKKQFALLMHVVSEVTAAGLLDLGFY
jgi:hypothetical protein